MIHQINPVPEWFAEWFARAAELQTQSSIVIGSRCSVDLKAVGGNVADYLNEFDDEAHGHWHSFDHQDLHRLAGNPATRSLVLQSSEADPHPSAPDSDLSRIARRIARLGGAVMAGQYSLDAAAHLDTAFRVCLCPSAQICIEPCHIWLNPHTFPRESLIAVIADSFLDWNHRRPGLPTAKDAPHPARPAEPDGRQCASL